MRGRELEAVRAGEEGGRGVAGRDGAEAGGVRGWRRRHGVRAVGAATLRCRLRYPTCRVPATGDDGGRGGGRREGAVTPCR